ncbi:MAG: ECF transporter S component [Oscillospiraceae bacterium]|nr:ECF transporter S component [Oscillospiraceae bacterium]
MANKETTQIEGDLKKTGWSARRIAIIAIFIALSAVGAMIKIPSPIGSIGLDSFPGYFCALAFGYPEGAIVIAVGHILSAAVTGFPLTIPFHLAIAASMALVACVFRFIGRKGGKFGVVLAVIVASLLNSFGLALWLLPIGGWALYVANIVPLLVASAVNAIIAAIAYYSLRNTKLINK